MYGKNKKLKHRQRLIEDILNIKPNKINWVLIIQNQPLK